MFWKRLQDRVVIVASAVFLAAIFAAVLLVDHRHQRMVMERAALEARTLRLQLTSRARVAPILDSDDVRIVVPAETAGSFLEPGRSAFITADGSLLWQSVGNVPASLSRSGAAGTAKEGTVSVSDAGRGRVFYRSSETVPHRLVRPLPRGMTNTAGKPSRHSYYRYPVTYHVLLDYVPYRRDIEQFRIDMAAVVLVAMLLLFVTTRAAIHYQLRPLARVTSDVGRLSGQIGEAVVQRHRDPEEIRVLADRINEFLVTLDGARRWEQETHRHIRTALETMKDTIFVDEVSQGGFMHSLNHMLSDILLMDFRTVSEEDKVELQQSVERMRDMLNKRLNALVSERLAGPIPVIDLVPAVERFRPFMTLRYGNRTFVIECTDTSLSVCVPNDDLSEMIGNLLRNAGVWSRGTVLLGLSKRDGMVRIVIEDDGPGFPKEDRALLLAWARGAVSRSQGHGIGLPYVNSLARSYGGQLHLADSARFGGARTVLDLPISPASSGVRRDK